MTTRRDDGPRGPATWLLTAFGALVSANAAVSLARGSGTAQDLWFALLLLVALLATAAGVRRNARWAWWAALAFALAGLFFVLPVAGTILLGGSLEPIGTGWDALFFPLTTMVLIALLAVLTMMRRAGAHHESTQGGS